MTDSDQIQQTKTRLGVELDELPIDKLEEFEDYSREPKRTYIVDDENRVVALALDGLQDLQVSSIEEL